MTRARAIITLAAAYRVGSQPPDGYIQWHEWAEAQAKGGLVQRQCPTCGLWRFPQEKCEHGRPKCRRPESQTDEKDPTT